MAERLASEHDAVRLIRSPTNRGYAGAVNVALPEARGDHVAVLNMDVVVSPGWLGPLVSLLEAKPDAGVACPLILLESDPEKVNAAGQNLHKTGLGFNRWLGKPREIAGEEPFGVTGLHGRPSSFTRLPDASAAGTRPAASTSRTSSSPGSCGSRGARSGACPPRPWCTTTT